MLKLEPAEGDVNFERVRVGAGMLAATIERFGGRAASHQRVDLGQRSADAGAAGLCIRIDV